MDVDVYHEFVDMTPDDPTIPECVRPSDWNNRHTFVINDRSDGNRYTLVSVNGVLGLEKV